ncbi:alpha/beta hydrolase [Sphingomonas gilva]|uniref:Alpha/beta hydrolase n=2 Tax=Sphingomonas gilva TaxID=2305907 RepID=A0A396RYU6_9SPHN|nr:alpha/beta hydrolase [Sphingomonas gilva]
MLAAGPPARAAGSAPAEPETIDLWPAGPPGAPTPLPAERIVQRSADPRISDRFVEHVARPRMAVFRPARANGGAVLVMPGGGYVRVVIDKEGHELGRWLSARGYTVFVLFYRLPGDGWAAGPDVALSDAQRAMRLIRHRARDYDIDPARVAAMGFSAGGHLCADLATRFAHPAYAPVDAADALSARTVVAAPIYPVIGMRAPHAHAGSRAQLIGQGADEALEDAHSPHLNVSAETPPTFLVHAEDDGAVPVENSLLLRAALRAKGIPVETHLFARGGHGFGLRGAAGTPASVWPELFLAWAKTQGLG